MSDTPQSQLPNPVDPSVLRFVARMQTRCGCFRFQEIEAPEPPATIHVTVPPNARQLKDAGPRLAIVEGGQARQSQAPAYKRVFARQHVLGKVDSGGVSVPIVLYVEVDEVEVTKA